jgi:hypothetical protein
MAVRASFAKTAPEPAPREPAPTEPAPTEPAPANPAGASRPLPEPHKGMPPLDMNGAQVSPFEFWPPLRFYWPVILQWSWHMIRYRSLGGLPAVANPRIYLGGMVNESKLEIFDQLTGPARDLIADYTSFDRTGEAAFDADTVAAMKAIDAAGLAFPLVVKPDIGCRGAGVRKLHGEADLRSYLTAATPGQRFIAQALVDHEAEAGVFYVRLPEEPDGFIFSLTLKYFPWVTGDGRSTLKELILADPRARLVPHLYLPRWEAQLDRVLPVGKPFRLVFSGSHCRGAIFRDGNDLITPEMTAAFDTIAKAIPDFYFGRFDVRFPRIEDLQAGRGFKIIEVNGASSEATHIWDRNTTLKAARKTLLQQFSYLWRIGAQNRRRGHRPPLGVRLLWELYKEKKTTGRHPSTD